MKYGVLNPKWRSLVNAQEIKNDGAATPHAKTTGCWALLIQYPPVALNRSIYHSYRLPINAPDDALKDPGAKVEITWFF